MDDMVNGGLDVDDGSFYFGDIILLSVNDGLMVGDGGLNDVNGGLMLDGGFTELLDGFVDVVDDHCNIVYINV